MVGYNINPYFRGWLPLLGVRKACVQSRYETLVVSRTGVRFVEKLGVVFSCEGGGEGGGQKMVNTLQSWVLGVAGKGRGGDVLRLGARAGCCGFAGSKCQEGCMVVWGYLEVVPILGFAVLVQDSCVGVW